MDGAINMGSLASLGELESLGGLISVRSLVNMGRQSKHLSPRAKNMIIITWEALEA